MKTLFRNPFFTLLRYAAGLALVLPALAWGFFGVNAFELAMKLLLLIAAAFGGVTLAALAFGWRKIFQSRALHSQKEHRFLCPACAHFQRITYACNKCEEELESFQVHTEGVFFNQCPHCQQKLFEKKTSKRVRAYCKNCFVTLERETYHQRKVHVMATAMAQNFDALRMQVNAPLQSSKDFWKYFCVDDGTTLRYVFDCSGNNHSTDIPKSPHALAKVEMIWIDTEGLDTLQVARALDSLVRTLELSEKQRRQLTICVRQPDVEAALKTRLETEFGFVQFGVEGQSLLTDIERNFGEHPPIPVDEIIRLRKEPKVQER